MQLEQVVRFPQLQVGERDTALDLETIVRVKAYHWYPSLQCVIKLIFLPIICFQDEFPVEFGKRDARVGVEVFRELREAGAERLW